MIHSTEILTDLYIKDPPSADNMEQNDERSKEKLIEVERWRLKEVGCSPKKVRMN